MIEKFKEYTLLLVDDEADITNNIKEILAPLFKEIFIAYDGKEGLKLFQECRADIVVSDILMPYLNGIEMVEKIKEQKRDTPVIYITAFNEPELILKALKQQAIAYLLKPVDIEELLDAVDRAVELLEAQKMRQKLEYLNRHLQQEVERLAFYDPLTSLPNRMKLLHDIKSYIEPTLAFIDIDSFTHINDLFGIEVGNKILKDFASFLKELEPKMGGQFYRVGSDEFAYLSESSSALECQKNIDKFYHQVTAKKFFIEEDFFINIDITIGVGRGKKFLLERADLALSKAQKEKKRYHFCTEEIIEMERQKFKEYISILKMVKKALQEDRVVCYFQEVVDKERHLLYYEALVRIEEENMVLYPAQFLTIAKEAKIYPQLSKRVVQKAVQFAKKRGVRVSINLSFEDIANETIRDFIISLVKKEGGQNIIFEILESESIQDFELMLSFFEKVRCYGVKIALDDFGSGYANFEYLFRLRPDFIKIDGSLIENMPKRKDIATLVELIASYCKKNNIKSVAEFVSSQEIFEMAKSFGIDAFQGFLFTKPIKME